MLPSSDFEKSQIAIKHDFIILGLRRCSELNNLNNNVSLHFICALCVSERDVTIIIIISCAIR